MRTTTHAVRANEERRTRELVGAARRADTSPAEADRLLAEAFKVNQRMATGLAQRYHDRGVELDDLRQVAMVGLWLSLQRWDPQAPTPFTALAVPTIKGELRRHFRDRAWLVRPPRGIQEDLLMLRPAEEAVRLRTYRAPSVDELSRESGLSNDRVRAAQQAREGFRAVSLDQPAGRTGRTAYDHWAPESLASDGVGDSLDLANAVASLGDRDRRILHLRFDEERTQSEIGETIGLSQMQVSRVLRRILDELRLMLDPALASGASVSAALTTAA